MPPFTSQFVRIPIDAITITPIASDAFTRADGALGNTGGGGSAEAGGSGLAWTAQLGTWGIATNKAACSAVDGTENIGVATVNAGTVNVLIDAVITRAAGNMGLVARYTDADNYIYASYDGTNWTIVEVVGGTPNTILVATAATYSATARTVLSLSGTKVRLYYADSLVGSEATTAVLTGNNHGLYTSDTGATFDNFVTWARGSGGEYAALDNYANP